MREKPVQAAQPVRESPRILCLQNSSIFEGFGGIEYYQDDFLALSAELCAGVCALVPRRTSRFRLEQRPYQTHVVRFSENRWIQKLQNRFSRRYLHEARAAAKRLRPTLLLCSHVALGPVAYLLSRERRIPYLTLVYGIEAWGGLWPQDEWCLAHSSGVISISHWTKRILVERGYLEDQIAVVHPPLPVEYETLPMPTKAKRVDSPLTLLTVSRLDAREQYKGHDHVLEALYRLRATEPGLQIHYIIQGEGTDRPRLEKMTRELDLSEWVEFRPAVKDRAEFESVYRSADVFVMPSRFGQWEGKWRGEGFGIVYLEAAAFGLPSVAYDCGGATDIIRHGENGFLVDPDNIAELARTIGQLAHNRGLAQSMGRKAHEMVMRNFTRRTVRIQLHEALERLGA